MSSASRSLLAFVLVATAVGAAHAGPPLAFERVPMRDVRYTDAQDLAASVAADGQVRVELPFTYLWRGQRYGAIEIGVGRARLVGSGEVAPGGGLLASALAVAEPGVEGRLRTPGGPTFEVLVGDAVVLAPRARINVEADPFQFAVRWWGLEVPGVELAAGAELILERAGDVRYQYLRVSPAAGLTAGVREPGGGLALRTKVGSVAGFALQNGYSIRIGSPDRRVSLLEDGPPPAGCAAPTGDWCQQADGAPDDAIIYLDSRFEEAVLPWTTNGTWHGIPDTTCPPGATTVGGASAYVGDDATCTHAPGAIDNDLWTDPPLTPFGPAAVLEFNFRAGHTFPMTRGEIHAGATFLGTFDTTTLNPNLWYRANPIPLPAGETEIRFRFVSAPVSPGIGWMVDDVFVYETTTANQDCIRAARYAETEPGTGFSSCAETVNSVWSFNETAYCEDCSYTFYALVECGDEMHLPLSDMEGVELSITEVVTGTTPTLTCENPAFRDPAAAPLIVSLDCCPAPGPEQWFGPAFSQTSATGQAAWGFGPPCGNLLGSYDLNPVDDNISCNELDPPCGGVLSRLSPGESQVMDCYIVGNPGVCGLYRIDVRSGGWVWDLFANCTGDNTENFQLFTNCEDAWAAFTPLPEITLENPIEVGTCPDTEIQFDLTNLSCADLADDFVVRATSNCVPADVVDWPVTGGLAANATRTESRAISVSCPGATITLAVDPDGAIAECSETATAAKCTDIPGADTIDLPVCDCAGTVPPAATADQVCVGAITSFVCDPAPVPGATYDWDWEDDGIYDDTGCNPTHVFPAEGTYQVRVRITDSGGCQASDVIDVIIDANDAPTEAVLLYAVRDDPTDELVLSWTAAPGAASYRVARGDLKDFYTHTVDDLVGIGVCDTAGALVATDPDDIAAPANYYYLVAPLGACGAAGPWGLPTDVPPVPVAIPSLTCP